MSFSTFLVRRWAIIHHHQVPTATASRIIIAHHSILPGLLRRWTVATKSLSFSSSSSSPSRRSDVVQAMSIPSGSSSNSSNVVENHSTSLRMFSGSNSNGNNGNNNNNNRTNSFSSYLYPHATEAPEVTQTTSKEAAAAAAAQRSLPTKQQNNTSSLPQSASFSSATAAVSPPSFDEEDSNHKKDNFDHDNDETAAAAAAATTGVVVDVDVVDHFDDAQILTEEEREQRLQDQKKQLNTKPVSSQTITATIPVWVPSNVSSTELPPPQTIITQLSNGIRVVSQETYGQVSTVGAIYDLGSRLEQAQQQETGICHLLEMVAFGSTQHQTAIQVTQSLQDWGGTRFASCGREQSVHCIDVMRPHASKAVALLQQVLSEPTFLPDEITNATRAMEYQIQDMPPEVVLGEAIQTAAYGSDQQLGQVHFCPVQQLSYFTENPTAVQQFWYRQVVDRPHGLVVAAAGMQHDELVNLVQDHFGHWQPTATTTTAAAAAMRGSQQQQQQQQHVLPAVASTLQTSFYRGGEARIHHQSVAVPDGLVRVALAYEVGGWHSTDLVAACVLQTLLGGGSSFSAGGPGKGMYSRLYRQVLNRYSWAESAEAFTAFHTESGLWGISGSTVPHKGRDMVQVFAEHVAKLAVEPVSDEELSRARNMLKCNVLSQLESRLVLFEDMGRQVLTYGRREDIHTTCEKIDSVSAEDVRALALKALQKPPTLACVGEDLSAVPRQDEIMRWFH